MKILLAIDDSPASRVATLEMAARPWPTGSSFEILTVVEPSHLWTTSEVVQAATHNAERAVREAVDELRSKGLDATGVIKSGDPKTVVLSQAQNDSSDFVIVGSHGASAITRFLLGNVAGAVLRYASCSVEVARERILKAHHSGFRVLLATDGSDCSTAAACSIASRPWPAGTEVRILSVVEMILPATRALLQPPFIDSGFFESARTDAMKRSQDAIARAGQILSAKGLDVSESISVLAEPPKTIILDEADRWSADLIVLGSHGRNGVDRFLLGSTSEAIAMHAKCSVEVIRKR